MGVKCCRNFYFLEQQQNMPTFCKRNFFLSWLPKKLSTRPIFGTKSKLLFFWHHFVFFCPALQTTACLPYRLQSFGFASLTQQQRFFWGADIGARGSRPKNNVLRPKEFLISAPRAPQRFFAAPQELPEGFFAYSKTTKGFSEKIIKQILFSLGRQG